MGYSSGQLLIHHPYTHHSQCINQREFTISTCSMVIHLDLSNEEVLDHLPTRDARSVV